MNKVLDTSFQNAPFKSRTFSPKESSLISLESNKENILLKRTNEELKEFVLTLERETKNLEKEKEILKSQLEESKRENDKIYK